mmetsp:Transcript_69772/g.110904  ORF Transcript_69772/g.110904 Transcript_69772/m.110904 type:complete len:327 (-) Transcript_69772:189-1169(-)
MSEAHCLPENFANISSGIINVVALVVSITMIPTLFRTWRYFMKVRSASTSTLALPEKRHDVLMWSGLIFQVVSFLAIWSCIGGSVLYCFANLHNKSVLFWQYTQSAFIVLLCTHYYLLLLILFLRLYHAFERSPCRLSPCTVRFYVALFVVQPVSFLVGWFVYSTWSQWIGLLIFSGTALLIVFLVVSIIALYVHKLIQLYTLSDGDKDLLTLITKSTLLTTLTLVISIIAYVPSFMLDSLNGYTYWIMELFLMVDVYGNYCFILLAYPMCTKTYFKVCGKCDDLFRGCCQLMLRHRLKEVMASSEMNLAKVEPAETTRGLEVEIR